MEARKFWNVLIVDDEPDIHEISELSLKRETVFGGFPLQGFEILPINRSANHNRQ